MTIIMFFLILKVGMEDIKGLLFILENILLHTTFSDIPTFKVMHNCGLFS